MVDIYVFRQPRSIVGYNQFPLVIGKAVQKDPDLSLFLPAGKACFSALVMSSFDLESARYGSINAKAQSIHLNM